METTIIDIAVLVLFLGLVVGLLEWTHRHTDGLPRAPFGADLEGDRDIARTLSDLRAGGARDMER